MAFKKARPLRFDRSRSVKKQSAPKAPPAEDVEEQSVSPDTPQRAELKLPEEHPIMELWELHGKRTSKPLLRIELPSALAATVADVTASVSTDGGSDGDVSATAASVTAAASATADAVKPELYRVGSYAASAAAKRLKLFRPPSGGTPDLDAQVIVALSSRRMAAWFFVFPPSGQGAELSRGMLENALVESDVTFGVDEALLDRLPSERDRYFHLWLAAKGEPPVNGQDGYVIDLFSRDTLVPLVEDGRGSVDYTEEGHFQSAQKGDVICELAPPTACQDGRTVENKVCYASAGQAAHLPRGRNTEISEDGTALLASCDGHVEYNGSFQVKPVMEITGSVDVSTGDVSCHGDLHIRGDVCSGFTVRATGNITVDGVVEASVVEAGGDLVVRKGVQGNNQAILRAQRNIYARYLESSTVLARENLDAECIINCEVYSDGFVTAKSGRGTIIGGTVRASKGVNAHIVGARAEQQTSVMLGGRPFEDFERDGLLHRIEELERELKKISRQSDGAAAESRTARMRMQLSGSKLRLQQYEKSLQPPDGEEPTQARLKGGIIYPGTEVAIGNASMRFRDEAIRCSASWRDGEIALATF